MGIQGALTNAFNLTGPRRGVLGDFKALSPDDQREFLQATASLLKQGIVGQNTLRVDGQPRVTDATIRLADDRLRHAPAYTGRVDRRV